ncbi:hypothetical protein [Hymenobacter sp. B81]|uniref:hypothetical protein n=1 Tax=Hymenobacter sp. B81 TaxID=3344878 RepID=UPI0037DD7A9F
MKLRLHLRHVVAFLLLNLLVSELHELAHISLGGLVCGCFGPRTFNLWQTCAACAHPTLTPLVTAAGPLLSYAGMWLGLAGMYSSRPQRRGFGFSLLFASLPFARIFTVLIGGGDELVIVRTLLTGSAWLPAGLWLMKGLVLLLAGLPLLLAYRRIRNPRPLLWVAGFAVGPLLFQFGYLFQLMNGLLQQGFLAEPWLLGTPLLVTLHTALVASLLLLLGRNLSTVNATVCPLERAEPLGLAYP